MAKKTYITQAKKLAHVLKHGSISTITEGPDYTLTPEQKAEGKKWYFYRLHEKSEDKFGFTALAQIQKCPMKFINVIYISLT